MVFNKKTTEYALYPDGAYPIDARSHFESFKEANETIIEGCISATQNYNEPGQEDRRYYIGQIITTSGPDAWQIISTKKVFQKLLISIEGHGDDSRQHDVYWGGGYISSLRVMGATSEALWSLESRATDCNNNETWTVVYAAIDSSKLVPDIDDKTKYAATIDSCLSPIGGGGGGGSSTPQQQSNWNETDATNVTYIQNKPASASVDEGELLKLGW